MFGRGNVARALAVARRLITKALRSTLRAAPKMAWRIVEAMVTAALRKRAERDKK